MPPKRTKAGTTAAATKRKAAAESATTTSGRVKRPRKASSAADDTFSAATCQKWFSSYEDPVEADMIEPEGIERLCADIGFPAESVDILVLAYTLGARRMGYFSRDEWLSGMSKLSAHSAAQLAKRLPSETARVLGDRAALEDLHKYAFNFSKAPESRNVDIDTALAMWSLYFVQFGDRLRRFAEFLQEKRPVKVVNRDQWLSMFEFLFQVNDDLSNYDDVSSAWPTLLDEFVEYERAKACH